MCKGKGEKCWWMCMTIKASGGIVWETIMLPWWTSPHGLGKSVMICVFCYVLFYVFVSLLFSIISCHTCICIIISIIIIIHSSCIPCQFLCTCVPQWRLCLCLDMSHVHSWVYVMPHFGWLRVSGFPNSSFLSRLLSFPLDLLHLNKEPDAVQGKCR